MTAFSFVFLFLLGATVTLGLIVLWKGFPRVSPSAPLGVLRIALILLLIMSVVALALTGYPAAFQHKAIAGYMLMLHVMLAGPFLFALAAISVLFLNRVYNPDHSASADLSPLTIVNFWILTGTGAATGITMLLAMTPLFGTDGQHALVATHRFISLFAAFSAALFAVCLFSDVRSRQNQTMESNPNKETV